MDRITRHRSGGQSERGQVSSAILRAYVFLGSGFLILTLFFYTQHVIDRLEKESEVLSRIFAQFCAGTIVPASRNQAISGIFSEVVEDIPFPVIVTDHRGVPWTWHGIPEELNKVSLRIGDVSYEDFVYTDPENPPPGAMRELLRIAARMDEDQPPIPFYDPRGGTIIGHVHYGDSRIAAQLRFLPVIQVAVLGIFLILGYLGYRGLKEGEQRSIWIGMAKETAHQLGTPISSLLGWLHLLRSRAGDVGKGQISLDTNQLGEVVSEMEEDLTRLNKIAYRFSNIGSLPTLKMLEVNPILKDALSYLRKRFDRIGRDIQLVEEFEEVPPCNVNSELLEWVVENLFRNSIDAMADRGGTITIKTGYNRMSGTVKITFSDDGRGMSPSEQSRAFHPGFSTKRRGWGLGLALSRRIIEDYHGGKIAIERSQIGAGTMFSITLPA